MEVTFEANPSSMRIASDKELNEFDSAVRAKAASFIQEKMLHHGLTCYSIAKCSGVSTNAVRRIMNQGNVGFNTLVKVIRSLGGTIFIA